MNPESNTDPSEESKRRSFFPRKLDQGWATMLGALLALIGTMAVIFYPRGEKPLPSVTLPPVITQTSLPVTATGAPTVTPSPTLPLVLTETSAPSLTPTASPTVFVIQPTVQLFGQLPPSDEEAVQQVVSTLMQAAQKLPLVIKDGFDNNDYGWSEDKDIYEKGIQCEFSLPDSQYHIAITSTVSSGPAICWSFAPRSANDFFVSFDAEISQHRIADIPFYYRYLDENNFYVLTLTPGTQTLKLEVRQDGEYRTILDTLYVPAIHKDKANQISLLALGDSQTISINGSGVALVSKAPAFEAGQFVLGIRLNEAEQAEELLVDNFELRSE